MVQGLFFSWGDFSWVSALKKVTSVESLLTNSRIFCSMSVRLPAGTIALTIVMRGKRRASPTLLPHTTNNAFDFSPIFRASSCAFLNPCLSSTESSKAQTSIGGPFVPGESLLFRLLTSSRWSERSLSPTIRKTRTPKTPGGNCLGGVELLYVRYMWLPAIKIMPISVGHLIAFICHISLSFSALPAPT